MTEKQQKKRQLAQKIRREQRGQFPLASERHPSDDKAVYVFVDESHRVFSTAVGCELDRLEALPIPDLQQLAEDPYQGAAARQLFIDVIFPQLHQDRSTRAPSLSSSSGPSGQELQPREDREQSLSR